MAELIEDPVAYPAMLKLAGCLCTELAAAGGPGLCFCGLLPGGDVMVDCGCDDDQCDGNGQAWVRLITMYPSSVFPVPDATAQCATLLAYQLEVGVMRCMPSFGADDGSAPSMDQQLAATRLQLSDMQAMRRAIACCFAGVDTDYILGQYTPSPTLGGCGGGAWTVTIAQEF